MGGDSQKTLALGLTASSGLGAAGSVLSARAGAPQAIPVPPPRALFPGVQENYISSLMASEITPQSFGTLTETARTGLPTDVGPAFEALKASMGRGIEEGRANLIEKFGVAGLRQGSDIDRAAVDFE